MSELGLAFRSCSFYPLASGVAKSGSGAPGGGEISGGGGGPPFFKKKLFPYGPAAKLTFCRGLRSITLNRRRHPLSALCNHDAPAVQGRGNLAYIY